MSRYDELQALLKKASYAYYQSEAPVMTDREFDLALKELEFLELEDGGPREGSITLKVGSDLSPEFKKTAHTVPMLSIDNSYNHDELKKWADSCSISEQDLCTASLKADGASLAVIYQDGKLSYAVTRGDGAQGDAVTENAKAIKNMPLTISLPGTVEVRGECVLGHKEFKAINARLRDMGKQEMANPRNAASGSLKLKNVAEAYRRSLSFVAFDIVRGEDATTQQQVMTILKDQGFSVIPNFTAPYKYMKAFIEKAASSRGTMPIDIDGVVIKVDNRALQAELGRTTKHIRCATAWKFDAQVASSKVLAMTLQVGRTGRITPVAELDPVALAGTTVRRASLHNFDEIARLGLKVGDVVFVEKGGEIIPKVTGVDVSQRSGSEQDIEPPKFCPECGSPIISTSDVDLRCNNFEGCAPQLQRRLEHFVSRDYMNIDDIGPALIEALVDKGVLKTQLDFFRLDESSFDGMEGIGLKTARKVLEAVELSKKNGAERLLAAMGVRLVGRSVSKALMYKYGSINELVAEATYADVRAMDGVGDTLAQAVMDWVEGYGSTFICEAEALGLNMESGVKNLGGPFTGEIIVLTGTLPNYDRPAMTKLLEEAGAKVTGSVSKKTTILLAGAEAGSKLTKAQDLGIKIVDENYVLEVLGISAPEEDGLFLLD